MEYRWTYTDQYGDQVEGTVHASSLYDASVYAKRFSKKKGKLRDFKVELIE